MQIKIHHLKKFGFTYHDFDPRGDNYLSPWARWFDAWVNDRGIILYGHPFKEGWTVESENPVRQIYSVKALNRLVRRHK